MKDVVSNRILEYILPHSLNFLKFFLKSSFPVYAVFQHGSQSNSQSESSICFCTWFTRSKMGNVLAASPTNPSSSSNVTSMPPPPPLTASPPIEEKPQSAEKKSADNNPGTYEELHKACKGRFSWWNAHLAGFVDFPVC